MSGSPARRQIYRSATQDDALAAFGADATRELGAGSVPVHQEWRTAPEGVELSTRKRTTMNTRATSSWRFLATIGGLLVVAALVLVACGGSSTSSGNIAATPAVAHSEAAAPRQITITLPPSGLTTLNNNAPADMFAFYVAESSVPAGASDLPQYKLYICSSVGADVGKIQTVLGITTVNLSTEVLASGFDATSCIQDALKTAKTVVFTQRETALPSGVALVELTFK